MSTRSIGGRLKTPLLLPEHEQDPEGSDSETSPPLLQITPADGDMVKPKLEKLDPQLVGMSVGYKNLYSGKFVTVLHQVINSDNFVTL